MITGCSHRHELAANELVEDEVEIALSSRVLLSNLDVLNIGWCQVCERLAGFVLKLQYRYAYTAGLPRLRQHSVHSSPQSNPSLAA